MKQRKQYDDQLSNQLWLFMWWDYKDQVGIDVFNFIEDELRVELSNKSNKLRYKIEIELAEGMFGRDKA